MFGNPRFISYISTLLDEAEYLVDVHVVVVLCLDLDELAGGGSVDWLYSIVGLDIADRGAFLELGADSRSRAVVSDIVSPDQLALGHSLYGHGLGMLCHEFVDVESGYLNYLAGDYFRCACFLAGGLKLFVETFLGHAALVVAVLALVH